LLKVSQTINLDIVSLFIEKVYAWIKSKTDYTLIILLKVKQTHEKSLF
jgi:hypothetical protein